MSVEFNSEWQQYLDALGGEILPIYLRHELTFDGASIHGRMHICRCVLFAEFMCRYYHANTRYSPKFNQVRHAIAFHDAGREGNGADQWEAQSARLCFEYLQTRNLDIDATTTSELITKTNSGDWGLEKRIVHDADVLDIMRPCCGHGGKPGFRENALRFLGERDDPESRNPVTRTKVIDEAWELIRVSEERKPELWASQMYFADLLKILNGLQHRCPLLSEYLLEA